MTNPHLTPEGISRPTMTIYAKPTRAEIIKWAGYAIRNSSIDYIDEELIEDFADGLHAFKATPPAPQETAGAAVADSPYGQWCPTCNAPVNSVTRGIPSIGICANGHKMDRRDTLHRKPAAHPTPIAAPTDNAALWQSVMAASNNVIDGLKGENAHLRDVIREMVDCPDDAADIARAALAKHKAGT